MSYNNSHNNSNNTGHNSGYNTGNNGGQTPLTTGHNSGHNNGYNTGNNSGYNTGHNSRYNNGHNSEYNSGHNNYGNHRDGGGGRNRMRGIRRNNRPEITQEQYNERFDYASNPEHNLFDQDDIVVSSEALADEKREFHDMGGEEGLKENLLRGIYSFGFEKPSRIQSLAIEQIIKKREILERQQSALAKTRKLNEDVSELLISIANNKKELQQLEDLYK